MSNENTATTTPVRFHFYSLEFTPYSNSNNSSNSILTSVINYIFQQKQAGSGHLIDRHGDRENEERRELFMTSAVIMAKEQRIRCSIALLRAGRVPKLKPTDKFKLVPLKTIGTIAEETHFYIDYNRQQAVICLEFNHHGPRITDIEYYLRNIARDTLKLSKATTVLVHMDTSIDKTLKELKNVLNLDIKIQPRKLAHMDTEIVGKYFTHISHLGQFLKPKFLKLEALYQSQGNAVKSTELNENANTMVRFLLNKFKTKPLNIDCFENFVVKYETLEGKEEVINLLRGKKEIVKEIDLSTITKSRQWYELIENDFNEFMQNLN